MVRSHQIGSEQYKYLLEVARKLTAQHDIGRLCEIILSEARGLTRAEGGTLYLLKGQGNQAELAFAIIQNCQLDIDLGGPSKASPELPPVPLHNGNQPNLCNVASYCAITGKLVNLADVYQAEGFDFSGTREFDHHFRYRTRSVLTLPLLTAKQELIGVLQLLNARDAKGRDTVFAPNCEPVIEALAEFAAIALYKQQTLHDQRELLVRLAGEPDTHSMLVRILTQAQVITHADGGTLYLLEDNLGKPACLEPSLILNSSLGLSQGVQDRLNLPPIPLYDAAHEENHQHIAAHAALSNKVINIQDSYTATEFDFSGAHKFDRENNYRTVSLLTIPLKDHAGDVIGVMQLINSMDPKTGKVTAFSEHIVPLVCALARYAAIALNNQLLVEEHKKLLDAFIQVLAKAIDAKSKHTSGHCQRVPLLTRMIAEAVCADHHLFPDFNLNNDQWYELHVASWLHDCGKLATPDFILDKSTKLHTLHDRIETVGARFAALRQQLQLDFLQQSHAMEPDSNAYLQLELAHHTELQQLQDDLAFLRQANRGGEFMSEADRQRVADIALRQWQDADGQLQPLLTADEVLNLSIQKGTLTAAERQLINDHMQVTIDMLESLPFPRKLRRVPEYAGGHHERMDGGGFPRGLTGEQMSIPARIMAIADIFEALTARDRPYKEAMKLSKALGIMQKMSDTGHIDPELFQIFMRDKVWLRYAEQELLPEQIDIRE